MKKLIFGLTCAATIVLASGHAQANRDQIMIVGSSTVYPFSKVVAERYGLRNKNLKAPKVEPTGTGGGFKEFCKGLGVGTPDIANASRRIKQSELDACKASGVNEIVEVLIGHDGIVVANSVKAKPMELSRKDLFLALAKKVPDPKGGEKLVDNPYKTWKQVNPELPDRNISVMGPPPTSGTRDAFVEMAMEGGCVAFDWIKALKSSNKDRFKAICHGLREDGAFVEAGENDNLIVRKLVENPQAFGIFGFSFLDQNADKVQPIKIDGIEPSFDSISDGNYPISRPLYFYAKKAHMDVIPGLREYLKEFTSERAWGEDGYLAEKGMIPLADERRRSIAKQVKKMETLQTL